jgi:MATE family multidrug resistance protein
MVGSPMPTTFRREARELFKLALPIAITQLSLMMLGVVDLLMVGRIGVDAVGAIALGNVWKMGTILVAMGVVFGMDPFVSQAHGAGDARGAGLALQRGILLAILASLVLAGLWLLAERGLVFFGQDPEIAAISASYVRVQAPSLPFFFVWVALRQYLTGRGIVKPALWIGIGANVLNVFLNWILIFGNLGCPALGTIGSGIATSVLQVFFPIALVTWIVKGRLLEGAWVPWSRAALDLRAHWAILKVGIPVSMQLAFEVWAFQIVILWAGMLGKTALAAHSIVFNLIAIAFMVPLGISLASVTRVGNLIGAGRHHDAQRSAWVAFTMAAGAMVVASTVFVVFRNDLPLLYNDDGAVVALAASLLPIAAGFQLFDGVQVVGGGIVRGMGRTRASAVFHLFAFYVLGLPMGWWLTFERGIGLPGVWWGLAIGLAVVSTAFVIWIAVRGPATMEPGAASA